MEFLISSSLLRRNAAEERRRLGFKSCVGSFQMRCRRGELGELGGISDDGESD
jgi:hypothetical protein